MDVYTDKRVIRIEWTRGNHEFISLSFMTCILLMVASFLTFFFTFSLLRMSHHFVVTFPENYTYDLRTVFPVLGLHVLSFLDSSHCVNLGFEAKRHRLDIRL